MLNKDRIFIGDCKDVLKDIDSDSVDCIVTDPPYGLDFMGMNWDKALPSEEALKECCRVLKPGAFGFFMCTPRQDLLSRMIIRLEDCGFMTGFTSLWWTYACLSDDTEVLTKSGWVAYNQLRKSNKSIYEQLHILTYDIDSKTYKWDIPSKWNEYQIEDTCYRIKCDSTDQLVTRNHRVLVEREGNLSFQFAETLGQTVCVPYLENLFMLRETLSNIPGMDEEGEERRAVLFDQLPAEGEYKEVSNTLQSETPHRRAILDGGEEKRAFKENNWRREPVMERGGDIPEKTRELQHKSNKICEVPSRVFTNGSERWVGSSSQVNGSPTNRQTINPKGNGAPQRSRSWEQCNRESGFVCQQSGSPEIRDRSKYKTCMARVEKELYRGLVFCPTVKTGCFVARRNGHIFLTGNSGFPKAANMSKLVDKRGNENSKYSDLSKELCQYLKSSRELLGLSQKDIAKHFPSKTGGLTGCVWNWENGANIPTMKQWKVLKDILKLDNEKFIEIIERAILRREEAEREIIGKNKKAELKDHVFFGDIEKAKEKGHAIGYGEFDITAPATPEAHALNGAYAGFSPKPAVEPVVVVMKPLETKSYVDQALKNGKGVTWLGDCKIPYMNDGDKPAEYSQVPDIRGNNYGQGKHEYNNKLTVKNDLTGRFPANVLCSDDVLNDGTITKSTGGKDSKGGLGKNVFGEYALDTLPSGVGGYGDSGTFSRYFDLDAWFTQRVHQLPKEEQKTYPYLIVPKPSKSEKNKYAENKHPTVKPVKLMSYLVTLGSRENDIVLDPYAGSGTTLEACNLLNRRFIGIDLEESNRHLMESRTKAPVQFSLENFIKS